MALIKCEECGKEISSTVKKCPYCGYKKKKPINKNFFGIGVIIAFLIAVISIVVLLVTKEEPLTTLEQNAVDCIVDYKAMLKNPDSLQVHDIRWEENELREGMIFIYIDSSGQNGFGGNNRSVARYGIQDGEITYQGSSNDYDSSWDRLIAKSIEENWLELKNDDSSIISVERVMKAVNNQDN